MSLYCCAAIAAADLQLRLMDQLFLASVSPPARIPAPCDPVVRCTPADSPSVVAPSLAFVRIEGGEPRLISPAYYDVFYWVDSLHCMRSSGLGARLAGAVICRFRRRR